MNHAFAVGGFQARANLADDIAAVANRKSAFVREDFAEVPALDIIHGDEFEAVGNAEIEDPDDIAMGHLAGEDQLLLETPNCLRMIRIFRANHFQRDQAIKLPILGLVDGSHAALAQHLKDFIAAGQGRAWKQCCAGRRARA
jgi:hypothetical protein